MNPEQAIQRLARAGILEREGAAWRTTPVWQKALMRAESKVVDFEEGVDNPRLPIGYALVDIFGTKIPEPELEAMVEAILPLEIGEEEELEPDVEEEEVA
jgi:hypothetical protein